MRSLTEGHRQVTDRHVRTQLLRADRRARRHCRPARDTGWPVGWQVMGYTESNWAFKLPSGQVATMNPPHLGPPPQVWMAPVGTPPPWATRPPRYS